MYRLFQLFHIGLTAGSTTHGSGNESISDMVIHHLGDHLVHSWPISVINERFLSEKLFGIFDMRITAVVLMMWLTVFVMILIFLPVARILRKETVSRSKWVTLWDIMISFVYNEIVEPSFDSRYAKKVMPFFCSLFFFILFSNLMGLIPGLKSSTGNLAVTAGLSVIIFLFIIGTGMVKQGPVSYFIHLVPEGMPVVVAPLMLVVEIVGLLIKPFALTIRLFANMTAGHVVIIVFLYLVIMFKSYWVGIGSVTGALMINLLEILVAFIQAYIFTTLSAMFIGGSLHSH
jgi:F-type H+-transporting ATPase subunit a